MRKRMETEERDATSRASFKCPQCSKTFTDLEVKILYHFYLICFRLLFWCEYFLPINLQTILSVVETFMAASLI